MTGGLLGGILRLILLLSACARVFGDQVNEDSSEPAVSYNKSLILYTEATENLKNVTGIISELNEDIEDNIKLKNEVKCYRIQKLSQVWQVWHDVQAVSVWVSWLMANSLCHGDLNMTGADTLWQQSR